MLTKYKKHAHPVWVSVVRGFPSKVGPASKGVLCIDRVSSMRRMRSKDGKLVRKSASRCCKRLMGHRKLQTHEPIGIYCRGPFKYILAEDFLSKYAKFMKRRENGKRRLELTSYDVHQGKGNQKKGVAINESGMGVKENNGMGMEDTKLDT